jgi:hypothetical protein
MMECLRLLVCNCPVLTFSALFYMSFKISCACLCTLLELGSHPFLFVYAHALCSASFSLSCVCALTLLKLSSYPFLFAYECRLCSAFLSLSCICTCISLLATQISFSSQYGLACWHMHLNLFSSRPLDILFPFPLWLRCHCSCFIHCSLLLSVVLCLCVVC